MYGTIARLRPLPGRERAVDDLGHLWLRERAPTLAGFVANYVLKSEQHPGEVLTLSVFESEETYRRNAADPDQHRWHERIRALLAAEPEWNDGAIEAFTPATVPL